MKLRVLGCDGGRGLGYNTTSLLFNDTILIDAGTIQSQLTLDEALNITDLFLTHAHLDHIVDLPFLLDATFDQRTQPLRIHGTQSALDVLMKHIFNDEVWPNFSVLPTPEKGQFTLHTVEAGETYEVNGLSFMPISVDHTVPTVGYKVSDAESDLVFSGDTAAVDSVWKVANACENLKAVIVDLSFPVRQQFVADISKHMTADNVAEELKKLELPCDVYAFHYKVGLAEQLEEQTSKLSHAGKPVKALRNFKELDI